jgi:hypothetical protein
MTSRLPAGVLLPVLVLALSLSPLGAADPAVRSLVKKFTEKQVAQATPLPTEASATRVAAPTASAPATLAPEATKPGGRKPSPPLASLPVPKAAGPLRILLVDDDASSNNAGGDTGAAQRSDEIFRALVSKAVGDRADAWSVEVVKNRENGPAFDRLRAFNVVLWYTGASYGANNDTVGREDEKHLRRYLEETGGAVILVSPGYVNNLVYGQSWEAAEHPFLKEVLAVNGCYGMVERGVRGTVRAHHGTEFQVERSGATETQFSVVNPDGAAIVFTSPLTTSYAKRDGGLPVAVAHAYGQGRIVYVGFTFENIPEKERAKAFETLLDAATGAGTPPVASAPPLPVAVTVAPSVQTYTPPAPAPTSPPASEPEPDRKYFSTGMTYHRISKVKIYTGNDNKEAASSVRIELFINGSANDDNGGINPDRLRGLGYGWLPREELSKNSATEFTIEAVPGNAKKLFESAARNTWGEQNEITLAICQQYGLRLDIDYEPNFFLDAWKIERVELVIDFGYWEEWGRKYTVRSGPNRGKVGYERYLVPKSAATFPRVISFDRGALLNNSNKKLKLVTDGFFFPK